MYSSLEIQRLFFEEEKIPNIVVFTLYSFLQNIHYIKLLLLSSFQLVLSTVVMEPVVVAVGHLVRR